LLILYNYGGLYLDLDVLLLRDIASISGVEWFYKWGCSSYLINGAIARLFPRSNIGRELLSILASIPMTPNSFEWGRSVYSRLHNDLYEHPREGLINFTVFPTCWFNPGWLAPDTKFSAHEQYPSAFFGPFAFHLHGSVWRINSHKDIKTADYFHIIEKIEQRLQKRIENRYIL
jgi:hypothetical protein